jgi:excisionase family DNA binding protein
VGGAWVGRKRPPTPALLNVTEVARRLGVSTATVYKPCDGGALAHVRVLNPVRVAATDLHALMRGRSKSRTGP